MGSIFNVSINLLSIVPYPSLMKSAPILRAIDIQNDAEVAEIFAEGFAKRGSLPLAKARLIAGTVTGSLRYLYDFDGPDVSQDDALSAEELSKMDYLYLASYFDPQENIQ